MPSHTELGESVRLAVHDASRVEWILSLPLAKVRRQTYSADVVIEIPSNVFAKHVQWDQLQELARLDGPEDSPAFDVATLDGLRRFAVTVASKLTRSADGFARHCRLYAAGACSPAEAAVWLQVAQQTVERARVRARCGAPSDEADVTTERALVDEYLSVRLLELLSGAERTLDALDLPEGQLAELHAHVAEALDSELAYRRGRRFYDASTSTPRGLEGYLERASRLKKHFQEVLFLSPRRYAVLQRAHHALAALAGVLAAMGAFVLQIALAQRATASSRAIGGFALLTVVMGVSYVVRDRLKELGQSWVAGRLHRLYAQRVVSWHAPRESALEGRAVLTAKESIFEQTITQPDALNPESGARQHVTRIRFTQKGTIEPASALVDSGITRVRQVFRYDLSPIFSRLDDAEKPVPLLDAAARRVRIARAPRVYRFPVSVRVTMEGEVACESGVLVVAKRGLERLEPNAAIRGGGAS